MDRRIDGLRIAACFLVVLLHVSALHFGVFGPMWWPANLYDSVARASVPLFFMISGATLLGRDEMSVGRFLARRLVRIFPPLLFWSAFYLEWLQYNGVSTGNWILAILHGPVMYHLWFFYALGGLYLFLPFASKFYVHSRWSDRYWFVAIWFLVASILPTVQSLSIDAGCGYLHSGAINDVYHFEAFSGYLGFFVLGAVLRDKPLQTRFAAVAFAIGTLTTAAATFWISAKSGAPCEFFYIYLTPLVVLSAVGLFSIFMAIPKGDSNKALRDISSCTLGVYGLHAFIIDPVSFRIVSHQVVYETGAGDGVKAAIRN